MTTDPTASLFQSVGILLDHIVDLQQMTGGQWLSLIGWGFGGAAAGLAVSTNGFVIATFVIAAIASHFTGQVQTSPFDRAAAKAAVKLDARLATFSPGVKVDRIATDEFTRHIAGVK